MALTEKFIDTELFLHESAISATDGLTDFGDPSYLTGLRVLLQALDSDTRFSDQGRAIIVGSLVGALAARLRAEKGFKDRPDCLHKKIQRPLVIMGIPRTGTTALHKLLSMDSQFQGIEFWLGNAPMPRPPRSTWDTYPGYQAAVASIDQLKELMPELAKFHQTAADGVDECLQILQLSFVSNSWGSSYRVPSYDRWWRQQNERSAYRYLANVMKLIGDNDPQKPWLLKNPGHIWSLDLLLEQFPDACIVQTHRDPARSIPSVCNILLSIRKAVQADNIDLTEIGAREMSVWLEATKRVMRAREISAVPVVDVLHRDFHAQPLAVVEKIYSQFNFVLKPDVELRMRNWLLNNPADKHGQHMYTAEEFGLSADGIRDCFGDYIKKFDL